MEKKLKDIITNAIKDNSLWKKNWAEEQIPTYSNVLIYYLISISVEVPVTTTTVTPTPPPVAHKKDNTQPKHESRKRYGTVISFYNSTVLLNLHLLQKKMIGKNVGKCVLLTWTKNHPHVSFG